MGEVQYAWLTPRQGRSLPVHRWFVFPHSYAPALVEHLFNFLDLHADAIVLDPFCGAGTTLVEAQRLGHSAIGVDMLPLAVLASSAKTNRPEGDALRAAAIPVLAALSRRTRVRPPGQLLPRALTPDAYGRLRAAIAACSSGCADQVLRLAILAIVRRCSRLVADGGWLRQRPPQLKPSQLHPELTRLIDLMARDIVQCEDGKPARVLRGDARCIGLADESIDAIVTSPPYPNRHDYTRVFGVELELAFGLVDEVKELRYRLLSSHPEARSDSNDSVVESSPPLHKALSRIASLHPDRRIGQMLRGYFADMSAVLGEMKRVLRPGGRAAIVVGNAQYCGVPLTVDQHLTDLARRAGFTAARFQTLRVRGNSAQQMRAFGRRPARESVVFLER